MQQPTSPPVQRRARILRLPMLLVALWLPIGCALETSREAPAAADTDDAGEGPTVYGQLGVSVDHVSTR